MLPPLSCLQIETENIILDYTKTRVLTDVEIKFMLYNSQTLNNTVVKHKKSMRSGSNLMLSSMIFDKSEK